MITDRHLALFAVGLAFSSLILNSVLWRKQDQLNTNMLDLVEKILKAMKNAL